MSESESIRPRGSNGTSEHSGNNGKIRTIVHHHLRAFGRAVSAIWPNKPALHLSQLAHCSERSAQYQIDGERKVTAKAMHVVEGEMLEH